jgi:hypothetical protein
LLFKNGCVNNQVNSDREALVNPDHGNISAITDYYLVYRYALESKKNSDVTRSLVYTILSKVNTLKAFKEGADNAYLIEESLTTPKLNKICWMTKFARKTKNILSSEEQDWLEEA